MSSAFFPLSSIAPFTYDKKKGTDGRRCRDQVSARLVAGGGTDVAHVLRVHGPWHAALWGVARPWPRGFR